VVAAFRLAEERFLVQDPNDPMHFLAMKRLVEVQIQV
jgi:hypothetical protein